MKLLILITMTLINTFFLTENGLFDFDLTFPAEAFLFFLFSLVVTFSFLSPISKQLDERSEFINYTLRKSTILLTFGYEKLCKCVEILTEESNELNRQLKITRNYTNSKFDEEISFVQKENLRILSKLKGDLSVKSAYLFSNITNELNLLTDTFFKKKFQ